MCTKLGDIVLLNRKKGGWFSSCQRFFTRMPYTHAAVAIGDVCGHESVLSADELIVTEPLQRYFDEDGTDIEIYSLTNAIPDEVRQDIINNLYNMYTGKLYGFTQVLWFVWRWLGESLGFNMKKRTNWVSKKGVVCSELVWYFLEELSKYFPVINDEIIKYNPDTLHAGDIANICKSLPLVYKLRLVKKGEIK